MMKLKDVVTLGFVSCLLLNGCTTPTNPLMPPGAVRHKAAKNSPGNLTLTAKVVSPISPQSVITTPGHQLKLNWTPSSDQSVSAYNVYSGPASGNYTSSFMTAGPVTTFTTGNLIPGTTSFYAVTAIGQGGESLPSNEASYTVPVAPPVPNVSVIQVSGTEFNESEGAYWQLNTADQFSSYTNNGHSTITWNTTSNLWTMSLASQVRLYSSPTLVNTNWTKLKGTNSVSSVAAGNPLGAPQPVSVLMGSYIVYWGLPVYDVYVTGDITKPYTFLTRTPSPYVFLSRTGASSQQFFKIVPVITNSISISPQN